MHCGKPDRIKTWASSALWPPAQPCGQRHVATTRAAGFRSSASQRHNSRLRLRQGEVDSCLFEIVLSVGILPQTRRRRKTMRIQTLRGVTIRGVSDVPVGTMWACCSSHSLLHLLDGKKTKLFSKGPMLFCFSNENKKETNNYFFFKNTSN